jgi:hypothetical protein
MTDYPTPWYVHDPNASVSTKVGFRPIYILDKAGTRVMHIGSGAVALAVAHRVVAAVNYFEGAKQT